MSIPTSKRAAQAHERQARPLPSPIEETGLQAISPYLGPAMRADLSPRLALWYYRLMWLAAERKQTFLAETPEALARAFTDLGIPVAGGTMRRILQDLGASGLLLRRARSHGPAITTFPEAGLSSPAAEVPLEEDALRARENGTRAAIPVPPAEDAQGTRAQAGAQGGASPVRKLAPPRPPRARVTRKAERRERRQAIPRVDSMDGWMDDQILAEENQPDHPIHPSMTVAPVQEQTPAELTPSRRQTIRANHEVLAAAGVYGRNLHTCAALPWLTPALAQALIAQTTEDAQAGRVASFHGALVYRLKQGWRPHPVETGPLDRISDFSGDSPAATTRDAPEQNAPVVSSPAWSPPPDDGLDELRGCWGMALGELQGSLARSTFDQYLSKTQVIGGPADELTLAVPNANVCDWLNLRLRPVIERAVYGVCGDRFRALHFVVQPATRPQIRE